CGAKEIARRGCVWLDVVACRSLARIFQDDETARGIFLANGAKVLHHATRHLGVRRGDEVAIHGDDRVVTRERGCHQETAEELTADVPFDARVAAAQAVGVDDDGWAGISGLTERVDAELPERVEQIIDGPLTHAGNAVKAVASLAEGDHRR